MKKPVIILLIMSCIISVAKAQNPVPNASFENWTGGEPDLWATNNLLTGSPFISQVSPGHTGLYAAQLNIVNQTTPHLYIIPAIPITQTYSTFSFYYKTFTNGSDVLLVFLHMFDSMGNYVGIAQGSVQTSVNSFTQMIIPVNYSSNNVAGFTISFEVFNNTTPNSANYFIVDDVSLSGPAGLNENNDAMQALLLNPNPATSEINVSYAQLTKGKTEISITDATGREVINKKPFNEYPGIYSYTLNISELNDGIYFCRLNNDDGSVTKRFQVIH